MSHISYQGFCMKYGMGKMFGIGYTLPIALNAGLQAIMGQPLLHAAPVTGMAGSIGMMAAIIAHPVSDAALSARNVGMTRGGKLCKAFQATAYAIPVAFGLLANAATEPAPVPQNPVAVPSPKKQALQPETPGRNASPHDYVGLIRHQDRSDVPKLRTFIAHYSHRN